MNTFRSSIVILILFFICIPAASAMGSCDFDEFLMTSYYEMDYPDEETPRNLLHFIEEHGNDIVNTPCPEERLIGIRKKASSFIHLDGNHEKPKFDPKKFSDEEVVALNLFFEYVMSKYNSFFSGASKKKKEEADILKLLSELSNVSYTTLVSVAKNASIQGAVTNVTVDYIPSWVYLWIRSDNPFKHNPNYDIDYSWLIMKRDVFLQSFPESKYSAAAQNYINEDHTESVRQGIKDRLNFHFGLGLVAGKTFASSIFDPHEDKISASIVQLRLQFFSFVTMEQIDCSFSDEESSIVGITVLAGYALVNGETFGIDILGGLGFSDVTFEIAEDKKESNTYGYLAAGAQILKRFPLGDVFDVAPKIQWIIKFHPAYTNELTGESGVGLVNQIFAGISFDVKLPMGKAQKKKG
ncbi:MAG: hypothetical protein J6U20_13780 [Fibrobacter sp.]|nr:hypothetical protein [Fibrobacter sp.]